MCAIEIVILMAGAAFFGSNAHTCGTAPDVHGVPVAVVALTRIITFGVAIHAAGMTQDGNECDKERAVVAGARWSGRLRRQRGMRKARSNRYASKQTDHA
jgi:hypothetical protein